MNPGEPIFEVAAEVFARWPEYVVGCVWLTGINNHDANDAVERILMEAEAEVQASLAGVDLKSIQSIAIWRNAFAECGWTPSRYLSSVEAILKRVSRGQPLPRISPIVDLANACALVARVPIGAHDVATLTHGPLTVRYSASGDRFMPMGGDPAEAPEPNEIIYASAHSVRTRRWVWRQSSEALIAPATTDVFFPVDGFDPATRDAVGQAVSRLAEAAGDLLGGVVSTGLVNRANPSFPLSG